MVDGEKSVGWVIVALIAAIAWLGWTFVAAAYAQSEQGWHAAGVHGDFTVSRIGRRMELREFIYNGAAQIPNFFAVTKFAFTRRLWLVGIFAGLEIGAVLLGRKMKQLEADFAKPRHRR